MQAIDAGDLRWRIAFDKRASVSDGYGNTQVGNARQLTISCQSNGHTASWPWCLGRFPPTQT